VDTISEKANLSHARQSSVDKVFDTITALSHKKTPNKTKCVHSDINRFHMFQPLEDLQ